MTSPGTSAPSRRSFLFYATGAMGAGAVVAAAWPLIDQFNPDARVRALDDIVRVTVGDLGPGGQKIVRWRHIPFVVVRRTTDMLAAMRAPEFLGRAADPRSERRQQPDYARNWHRSVRAEYGVMAGICTHCACVLQRAGDPGPPDGIGHFICPCCASRYDSAGYGYHGPTRFNLAVPPHVFSNDAILLGKNPPGELFKFDSVERI